ncbi:MAG: phosphoglycerate dehydrogenase [Peptococcaceae bacterium]|nr:phosphoglycerate dehydrogenase [Peptococcaceae bacterium]
MRILVSDDVSEKGVALLREHFDVDVKTNMPPAELLECIGNYDGLVTRSQTQVTEEVIAAAKNLKVIGRAGVGVDNINIPAATARGIVVVNAPEGNTIAAVEHTIGMTLAMTRHIPQAHQSIQEGKWDRKSFTGIQLSGKTLGIIGVGRIGSRVAKRMQAMEMTTIGYDPYITEERARQVGVELVDFDTLLARSDYITLHTPLTKETRNMVDAAAIAKMKDGVRLVNCARGECFDVHAIADAIKAGKVAGAAIDVYPDEPLTLDNNPFLGMFNVVQTSHLGASTIEAQEGVAVDVAYGVIDALNGKPVMNAVNMAPIPKSVAAVIEPYFSLAERMGTIAIYLADGPVEDLDIEYTGALSETETQHLTTAFLKGFLSPSRPDSVNYDTAPGLAKKRNLNVKESKSHKTGYYSTAITVKIKTSSGEHFIAGTLFDGKDPKIVQIDQYSVDFDPKGYLLLVPHIDQPNMIGQIATILGKAAININGMQVGRTTESGTNIMAVAVDDDIPNDILLQLSGIEGILDVKLIHCEE